MSLGTTYNAIQINRWGANRSEITIEVASFKNTNDSIRLFLQQVFDPNWWDTFNVGDVTEAILSISVFPFNVVSDTGYRPAEIYMLGKKLNADVMCDIFVNSLYEVDCGDIEIPAAIDFTDLAPFSKYYLYLPFKGYIELEASEIVGRTLSIHAVANLVSGDLIYVVDVKDLSSVTNRTIGTYTTKCSLEISVSGQNANLNNLAGMKAVLSSFGAGLGIAQAVGGIMTGNPIMAGAGIMRAEGQYKQIMSNTWDATRPYISKGDVPSGGVGFAGPGGCFIVKTKQKISDNINNITNEFGRPLMKSKNLNNCQGYTKFKEVHIAINQGSSKGITQEELDMLENLLLQGVRMKVN